MPLDNVVQMPIPNDDDPFGPFNTPKSPILFPVGERKVGWEARDRSYLPTMNHKAIIRLNAQGTAAQLLNIVGSDYKLVHNRELFTRVEETMKQQMLPDHLHTVQVTDKVSGFGRICYRHYVFPSIKCKVGHAQHSPASVPPVAFRIIVQNGYGGSALRIYAGAIDFYCGNGMIHGDHIASYRKHTKGISIDGLSEMIEKALLSFASDSDVWSAWANKPIPHDKAQRFLASLSISPKLREHLTAQFLREADVRGRNLWALYSALTYYASHGDTDSVFKMRSSVGETNTEAHTMLQREIKVSRWTQSREWKELELA